MTGGSPVHERKDEIRGLTGIRAFAAAWVVIEHFRLVSASLFPGFTAFDPWIRSGYLGVEIFFVLSGFIISYTWADRLGQFSWAGYRDFIGRRLARIYPVHLVTLLTMLLLVAGATLLGVSLSDSGVYTLGSFVGNIFMLQALPLVATWNDPAWSISAEFAAYLAFPAIAVGLGMFRTARRAFGCAALVALIGVAAMLIYAATIRDSPTSSGLILLRIATEFTVGCLLFAGWRHLGPRRFGMIWDWVGGGAALLAIGGIAALGGEGARGLILVPIIAIFVLSCAGATGPLGRLFGSRLLNWGGRISYSVYMTHFIVLMILGEALPAARFEGGSFWVRLIVAAAYYLGAIGAGAVCYYLVEEPGRRALQGFLDSRRRTRSNAVPESR